MNFVDFLVGKGVDEKLVEVLVDVSKCFFDVALILRKGNDGGVDSFNVSGDKQVKMDVLANDVFVDRLKVNESVGFLVSEEMEDALDVGESGFSVVFDPLDGSSLVDVNLAVGSIVGVYEPRLSFMVSVGDGVFEFLFDYDEGEFVLWHSDIRIDSGVKMFAPGNLKVGAVDSWYFDMLSYWVKNEYKLRYSGGMVPDVNQILRKGGGVFVYPGDRNKPNGKLRLLYECAPVAFLIENAGGKGVLVNGERILDVVVDNLHQRVPVVIGGKEEVDLVVERWGLFDK